MDVLFLLIHHPPPTPPVQWQLFSSSKPEAELHNNNNWQNTHIHAGILEDLFPHSVYLPTSTKSFSREIACLHAGTHPTPSSTGNILPMTAGTEEWVCRVRGHCKILIKIIDRNISSASNLVQFLNKTFACHMPHVYDQPAPTNYPAYGDTLCSIALPNWYCAESFTLCASEEFIITKLNVVLTCPNV